jgi:hypothetical protein
MHAPTAPGSLGTLLSVYHDSILLCTTHHGSIVEYTTAYEWHSAPNAIGNHLLSNFGVLGYNHSELFFQNHLLLWDSCCHLTLERLTL